MLTPNQPQTLSNSLSDPLSEGKRFLSGAGGCSTHCGLLAAQKYVAVCSAAFRSIMESEPFFVSPRSPVNLKCSLNGPSTLSSLNSEYPYPTSFMAVSPGDLWYHSITLKSLCPWVQKSCTLSPAFLKTAEGCWWIWTPRERPAVSRDGPIINFRCDNRVWLI